MTIGIYTSQYEESALVKIGAEIRALREEAGMSQDELARDIFGWGRDAISKIETAKSRIQLADYLRVMWYFRDLAPAHPAVALAARMFDKKMPAAARR